MSKETLKMGIEDMRSAALMDAARHPDLGHEELEHVDHHFDRMLTFVDAVYGRMDQQLRKVIRENYTPEQVGDENFIEGVKVGMTLASHLSDAFAQAQTLYVETGADVFQGVYLQWSIQQDVMASILGLEDENDDDPWNGEFYIGARKDVR